MNKGGILKLNHNSNNHSLQTLDIMKLYLLEGASEIKFNLIGKSTNDTGGTARPDWCIPNITLKLKDPPQSFSVNYIIQDASSVPVS